jgi:hypothetical protein
LENTYLQSTTCFGLTGHLQVCITKVTAWLQCGLHCVGLGFLFVCCYGSVRGCLVCSCWVMSALLCCPAILPYCHYCICICIVIGSASLTLLYKGSFLLIYRAVPFFRSCQLYSHSRTSQHFMEPECSLPCSQEPSTGLFPEPDQSSPYVHFPKFRSFMQRIRPGPRPFVIFRNKLIFLWWGVVIPTPNPLAGGPPPCRLSAAAYSIYTQLPSISGGRLLRPQPEEEISGTFSKEQRYNPKDRNLQEVSNLGLSASSLSWFLRLRLFQATKTSAFTTRNGGARGSIFDWRTLLQAWWGHCIFQLTQSFQPHYVAGVDSASNRNGYL